MKQGYPMWFKDAKGTMVVKFDNLTSGVVVEDGIIHKVGYRSYEWIDHTNTYEWIDVTDQYKVKEMENSAIEINTAHAPTEMFTQITINGRLYDLVEATLFEPEEPTIEKWEPKGGEWIVYTDGVRSHSNSTPEYASFGIEYATKEQAEKAYKQIRKHNRLLAWLAENDDGWEADWTNSDSKYYVAYTNDRGKYEVYDNYTTEISSAVYMSEINAYKLADLLNKGIVEL